MPKNITDITVGETTLDDAGWALRFTRSDAVGGQPSTAGHNVYGGRLHTEGVVYGDSYIDMLVIPRTGDAMECNYAYSSGWSGLHIWLLGLDGGAVVNGVRQYSISGNVSTDTAAVDGPASPYSGSDVCFQDQPVHIACAIVNGYLITFMNGVPCRKAVKSTGRMVSFSYEADAYVGGSDHSGFNGHIRYIRIFEDGCPVYIAPANGRILRPEIRPRASYEEAVSSTYMTACLLYDFSHPQEVITNHGVSLVAGRTNHGVRQKGLNFDNFNNQFNAFPDSELPQWERVTLTRPTYPYAPTAAPSGAEIFDSFSRANVDYMPYDGVTPNYLGLGSTEGGSDGVKAWQDSSGFGILSGRAYKDTGITGIANVVTNGVYKRVNLRNNGNEMEGQIVYGSYDFTANTGIKAVHGGLGTIALKKVVAGVETTLGTFNTGGATVPATIGIEYTTGKHIRLYVDGTLQVDYNDSASAALTGVRAGMDSTSCYTRVDTFEVRAAAA